MNKNMLYVLIIILALVILYSQIGNIVAETRYLGAGAIYKPIKIRYGYLDSTQIILDRFTEKGISGYWYDVTVVFQIDNELDIQDAELGIYSYDGEPILVLKSINNGKFITYANEDIKLVFIYYYGETGEDVVNKITAESIFRISFSYSNGEYEDLIIEMSSGTISISISDG